MLCSLKLMFNCFCVSSPVMNVSVFAWRWGGVVGNKQVQQAALTSRRLKVGSGWQRIEVFGKRRKGGGYFCLPPISCARNNAVLSCAQLIVLILPLPAGHVTRLHEWSRL